MVNGSKTKRQRDLQASDPAHPMLLRSQWGICSKQSVYCKSNQKIPLPVKNKTCSSDVFSTIGNNCTGHCMFPKESRVTLGNSRMPQARKDAAMAMEKDVFRWSAHHRDKYQNR